MGETSQKFKDLPDSVQNLVLLGARLARPSSIILFGSRARGDNRENSDFDIAFKNIQNRDGWLQFLEAAREENITLFKVDILDYEESNAQYQRNIDQEGVILYET